MAWRSSSGEGFVVDGSGPHGAEDGVLLVEIGRRRGVPVRIDSKRWKGSHVMVYYGPRKTVVKDRRKEIGAGLLSSMIRQLGLEREDFR